VVVVGEAFFEGFFRGIARAGQVKALNSFNFDDLGYIKALVLNTMEFDAFGSRCCVAGSKMPSFRKSFAYAKLVNSTPLANDVV